MKQQSGFTLIELVMVIVILGILAATALPKFTSLKGDADLAAVQGVAGAMTAGSAMNFATKSLHPGSGVAVAGCKDGLSLLDVVPSGYTSAALSAGTAASGTSVACTVTNPNDSTKTAGYTVIGT